MMCGEIEPPLVNPINLRACDPSNWAYSDRRSVKSKVQYAPPRVESLHINQQIRAGFS